MATIRNFFEYPGDLDNDYPQANNKSSWISPSFFGQPVYSDIDGINQEESYNGYKNARVYSLGYEEPSEDEIIDFFLKNVFTMENPTNTGMNSKGLYEPYEDKVTRDANGSYSKLVGPGIKLESHPEMAKLVEKYGGVTKQQIFDYAKQYLKQKAVVPAIQKYFKENHQIHKRIPTEWYAGLVDMYWQAQNNFFNVGANENKYPTLFRHIAEGNMQGIYDESKVRIGKNPDGTPRYDERRAKERNKYFFIPIED